MKLRSKLLLLFISSTCAVILIAWSSHGYLQPDYLIEKRHDYRKIGWDALVPKGWGAKNRISLDIAGLDDSDPRAGELLKRMKEQLDSAPAEPSMDGVRINISGFIVPLEFSSGQHIREFLIVPYFGACIHMPPPPANQIIHAFSESDITLPEVMLPVWVKGTLMVGSAQSELGNSSYTMNVDSIEPYLIEDEKLNDKNDMQ